MALRRPKEWKMENEVKVMRIFSRVDARSFGIGLITGCILVSLTYFTMSKTESISYPTLNSEAVVASNNASSSIHAVDSIHKEKINEVDAIQQRSENCSHGDASSDLCRQTLATEKVENPSLKLPVVQSARQKNSVPTENSELDAMQQSSKKCSHGDASSDLCGHTEDTEKVVNSTLKLPVVQLGADKNSVVTENSEHDGIAVETKNFSQTYGEIHKPVTSNPDSRQPDLVVEKKPLCDFSDRRSAICDIEGDVRIIGKNLSSVILVNATGGHGSSWQVKPYPRKWDNGSMENVRIVNVKALSYAQGDGNVLECSVKHSVPAVVFSISGFTGNYFHDMTDVLVPLFQTARQFDGQVQFVITNYKAWWISKYAPFVKRLSVYEVIDYDKDERVHCFQHVIVGLRSDRDMTIDPKRSPNGYSMPDFMKFMRDTYGLEREFALKISENPKKRPRLLLVSRARTRKFMNVDKIVKLAEKVGFEVVIAEAKFGNVAEFSRIVNSCDAMMGVHGAGLTNFVFLPLNSVLIQVVPLGQLDWLSRTYFREPSKYMKLGYLEYTISVEESTLTELYARDDPVFTDPKSIHKLGWFNMGAIYLDKQNVKLDVKRFKPVLQKALEFLQ